MSSSWFPNRRPSPDCDLRLLCLPYAGGDASAFREWGAALPDNIEVVAIELPGHGQRMAEEPCRCMSSLVDVMAGACAAAIDRPFAIFGHSMGASIAIELASRLATVAERSPVHVFVSGAQAPHIERRSLQHVSREELLVELRRWNGVPEEVLANNAIIELFIPILRADFALVDTRARGPVGGGLAAPLTVFSGIEDPEVTDEGLKAWRQYTSGTFDLQVFPGGHFFLDSARSELLHEIGRRLVSWRFAQRSATRAALEPTETERCGR